MNLLKENAKIRTTPKKRRTSTATVNKTEKQKEILGKTFSMWPANTENIVKIKKTSHF